MQEMLGAHCSGRTWITREGINQMGVRALRMIIKIFLKGTPRLLLPVLVPIVLTTTEEFLPDTHG